jgi:hypothetical protein
MATEAGIEPARAGGARPVTEQSTAQLVQHAGEQLSRLVRDELALARAELADKGRRAGFGAGLFAGAGLVVLYALGALILAAIMGLAEGVSGWLAALLIGAALLIVAGSMVLLGRLQMRRAMPPVPFGATRGIRADVDVVTAAVRRSSRAGQVSPGERGRHE